VLLKIILPLPAISYPDSVGLSDKY